MTCLRSLVLSTHRFETSVNISEGAFFNVLDGFIVVLVRMLEYGLSEVLGLSDAVF